jgi:Putative adhesin
MKQQSRVATWLGAALGAVSTLLVFAALGHASDRQGNVTEEFHQVYALSAEGRIELENINGPVHISGWDRNEVKVDAVKRAWSKERLDEAKIEISSRPDSLSIRTAYPGHEHNFWNGRHDNPASVEYTLVVPRRARLDEIKLVNGSLDIQDVAGEVRASCVNGRLAARNLGGRADLDTVNGELDASVGQMPASPLELSAVNGTLRLTLPSDAKADLEASTVSGRISNDFGLAVSHHSFVGHSLHGELGGGGTRVKLSNVNGRIEILHANDNRPLSPAKNLERGHSRDDDDDDDTI